MKNSVNQNTKNYQSQVSKTGNFRSGTFNLEEIVKRIEVLEAKVTLLEPKENTTTENSDALEFVVTNGNDSSLVKMDKNEISFSVHED